MFLKYKNSMVLLSSALVPTGVMRHGRCRFYAEVPKFLAAAPLMTFQEIVSLNFPF